LQKIGQHHRREEQQVGVPEWALGGQCLHFVSISVAVDEVYVRKTKNSLKKML
jgi:hypothetical protein